MAIRESGLAASGFVFAVADKLNPGLNTLRSAETINKTVTDACMKSQVLTRGDRWLVWRPRQGSNLRPAA